MNLGIAAVEMSAQLGAAAIARLSLHDPAHLDIQLSQTVHRLDLLQQWSITAGAKVLELGCGQGDCTTVLASAVGEEGSVVAIDPADLEYGRQFIIALVLCRMRSTNCTYRRSVYNRTSTESDLARSVRSPDIMDPEGTIRLPVFPSHELGI